MPSVHSLIKCRRFNNIEGTFDEADVLVKYYLKHRPLLFYFHISILCPCHYEHGPKVCYVFLTPTCILSDLLIKITCFKTCFEGEEMRGKIIPKCSSLLFS